MADTEKVFVRNVTKGYRGLNAVTGYVELNPGESRSVEVTEAEFENAKSTNYFEFGDSASDDEGDKLPTTHKALDKLATDEGVTFAAGVTSVADKQAAILAARQPADQGNSSTSDDLDNMSDADLKATVAALTGKPVDSLTDDRDELLKLARATS